MRRERGTWWGSGRDCPRFREAISARLDGEDPGMAEDAVDGHLARCPDCARFAEVGAAEHRRLRVRPARPVPDLTGEILAELAALPLPTPSQSAPLPDTAAARRRVRRRVASVAAATVVVVGGGFGAGALLGGHERSRPASAPAPGYPGATITKGAVPKPSVMLTDTAGRPYDIARATAGRVTLVYFGYTHCPDLCPINMALTASALRSLPASQQRRITVVFVTTDPARDKPAVLRAWLDRFDPSFVGLTGSLADIHAAEVQAQMPLSYIDSPSSDQAMGHSPPAVAKVQDYEVVHAAYTLVYAADGRANLTVDDSILPGEYATTLSHVLSYGFRRPA